MSALLDEIRKRPPAYRLTAAEAVKVQAYFEASPSETAGYLCYDGRVLAPAAMAFGSRTAQLVSIATVGFPMPVSRRHLEPQWIRA